MNAPRPCTILLAATLALGGQVLLGPLLGPWTLTSEARAGPRPPDADLSFACDFLAVCPPRTAPGAPDRDVRPFAGTLGRPCAWRERPTPEGPRRVRACW